MEERRDDIKGRRKMCRSLGLALLNDSIKITYEAPPRFYMSRDLSGSPPSRRRSIYFLKTSLAFHINHGTLSKQNIGRTLDLPFLSIGRYSDVVCVAIRLEQPSAVVPCDMSIEKRGNLVLRLS
jgi:hypothetical protein